MMEQPTSEVHELSIERFIAAPPAVVYHVWTARMEEWWAPKPWTTHVIAQELRPGGRGAMEMHGPAGEVSPMEGVYLEVVEGEKIVFTNAFTAGWVPNPPFMVGIFTFAPEGDGTRYTAICRHWDAATKRQHEEMGFHAGWGQVTDQLAALVE